MGFNSAFKGLNAELNPICHLPALLGAHLISHVSSIRVKMVLSEESVKWIELSRHMAIRKAFAITAKQIESN